MGCCSAIGKSELWPGLAATARAALDNPTIPPVSSAVMLNAQRYFAAFAFAAFLDERAGGRRTQ